MSKQTDLINIPDAITVDGSNNVGIGTSSPSGDGKALQIHGSSYSTLHLTNSTTGASISDGFDIVTDGSEVLLRNRESAAMRFATGGTERMRILSGGGLTFNGDTAAANALNDYEEGTFTAALTATSSGTITLNSSYDTFFYTKVGNLVHISGYIRVSSVSSPTGVIRFTLPFTVANLGDSSSAVLVYANNLASGSVTDMWAECSDNRPYVYIYASGGTSVSGTSAQQTHANSDFRISGTYKTNA